MYATLESLKAYLRIDETDELDDAELTRALQVASAEIDHLCSQSFAVAVFDDGPTNYIAVPRQERTTGTWIVDVPPFKQYLPDLYLWSSEDQDWTTPLTLDAYPYRPANGAVYTQIVLPSGSAYSPSVDPLDPESSVLVSGIFGWQEVPAPVEQACLIQAARIHRRRDAVFGIVNSLDGSSQARLRNAVDSDVAVMLRGYIKYWAAR